MTDKDWIRWPKCNLKLRKSAATVTPLNRYRLALATTCTILLAALLYVAVQHHRAVNIANFWRQQWEQK